MVFDLVGNVYCWAFVFICGTTGVVYEGCGGAGRAEVEVAAGAWAAPAAGWRLPGRPAAPAGVYIEVRGPDCCSEPGRLRNGLLDCC